MTLFIVPGKCEGSILRRLRYCSMNELNDLDAFMKPIHSLLFLILGWSLTIEFAQAKKHKRTWDYPLFYYQRYEVPGSEDFQKFDFNLRTDGDVEKEFANNKETGVIGYLLYQNGQVVVDRSDIPTIWEGDFIYQDVLPSHSMGKSLVSYVAGHAICEGYIGSVNDTLAGWETVENTLFENQVLIDLLNMQAGDDNYVGERIRPKRDNILKKNPKVNVNTVHLDDLMDQHFQNTKPKKPAFNAKTPKYNYSALTTNVIMNYVIHRSGDDWEKLLHKVFNEHVKVKDKVYFLKTLPQGQLREGTGRYSFYAGRYDFLRIALAMLNDWKNDTCAGKYLKMLHQQRIKKSDGVKEPDDVGLYTKSYGGQFHFDVYGLEDRTIIGLSGFAGQQILIDVDNDRIIVVNSTYKNYDWEKIVYDKIQG